MLVSSVALHGLGVRGEVALSIGRTGGSSSGLSGGGVTTGGTCWLALRGGMQFMLGLVVKSCVAGESADGRSGVGTAVVEGVSVGIDGVAIAIGAGVEGAGGVGDGGAGVDDAAALLLQLLALLVWMILMVPALLLELFLLSLLLLLLVSVSALMVQALLVMLAVKPAFRLTHARGVIADVRRRNRPHLDMLTDAD